MRKVFQPRSLVFKHAVASAVVRSKAVKKSSVVGPI